MNTGLGAFEDAPGSETPTARSDTEDHSEHAGRVTVDLDGYAPRFEFRAVQAYHALEREADSVDVTISSSGEGLHLVGWYREELSFEERMSIRARLGDDTNRQAFDAERHRHGVYTGVLWSEKSTNPDGVKDRSFRDVYDALEHMTMTNRSDAERMNRLANDGHRAEPSLARHAEGLDA